jgi:ABC-type sugar transport system ATPase subunit
MMGSGRTAIMRSIFGIDRRRTGEILVDGKAADVQNPADAVNAGIARCFPVHRFDAAALGGVKISFRVRAEIGRKCVSE